MNSALTYRLLLLFIFQLCITPLFSQRTTTTSRTWAEVKKAGNGTLTLYWHESQPFIYKDKVGRMSGIEAELMEGFKKYLKEKYQLSIQIVWKETPDFGQAFSSVADYNIAGTFAASAFSVTPAREAKVSFSPSYMADICVLISSQNVPIIKSQEEFKKTFAKLTAVTIRETTYESDLKKLEQDENLSFKVKYIPSSENILNTIAAVDDAFGFIDLPVYMMIFSDDPSVKVRRQNMFPIIRQGYGIIYPKNSDWAEPVNEYFNNKNFKSDFEQIISHYIDPDLYYFVEGLARQSNAPMALLTKEKEIQSKDLADKSEKIEKDEQARNVLIVLVITIFFSLLMIIALYRKSNHQKEKIETQNKNIEIKSLQLEKRNQHLVALDEEKNNLIKILAHDLRTPIHHVQGLAQVFLLSNPTMDADQKMIIQQISDSSLRLNKMITNLLDIDAIENDRIKIVSEDINISSLVEQVVKSFARVAEKKNIMIHFSSRVQNSRIKGDSLFLVQVFENLISNALKFSEKGKTIEVNVTEENDKIMISVKDQGPGLTPEDQQSLFKKFQRLSARPTDGESSLGLGLSIVKKYVELMGGRIHVTSERGMGADFIVEFYKV